jgi:hypothetical protein
MSAFKEYIINARDQYSTRNIEKIDNKLNFGNHIVPDFWHNLINYEASLIANNLELRFHFGIKEGYYGCELYYKLRGNEIYINTVCEEDYLTYIQLFCKYNITGDTSFYINGISYEIFNDHGIQYIKNIRILIDTEEFDSSAFIRIIEKTIRENPDYNFAKFNDNSDIKIALKD